MSKKGAIILICILYIMALVLLFWASWKIALGMILFGWAMNIENKWIKP
jgi:hypothetical protein